jgi:negative regulator of sigma E activity
MTAARSCARSLLAMLPRDEFRYVHEAHIEPDAQLKN